VLNQSNSNLIQHDYFADLFYSDCLVFRKSKDPTWQKICMQHIVVFRLFQLNTGYVQDKEIDFILKNC